LTNEVLPHLLHESSMGSPPGWFQEAFYHIIYLLLTLSKKESEIVPWRWSFNSVFGKKIKLFQLLLNFTSI
jgi:hypothetical protein